MAGLEGEEVVAAAAAVEASAVVLSLEWGLASFGEEISPMEVLWVDDEGRWVSFEIGEDGWCNVVSEGLCEVSREICPGSVESDEEPGCDVERSMAGA